MLSRRHVRAIEAHARKTYPEECCGFLLGDPASDPRTVSSVRRARNVAESNRKRRYVIDPRESLRVELSLSGTGQAILGYYHSHPNHPAVPSAFDQARAWPWYSYVILSIVRKRPADLRAWILEDEPSAFRSDPLVIQQ